MLTAALHALALVTDPVRLAIMMGGVVLGLLLGVIPGLGGIVGLALLIPLTYHMDGYAAFALLLGMAATTTVSDFIPAVLFGVPGTVGAAATVLDGHALAKMGQVQRTFGAGYASATAGGVFGAFLLALAIPVVRPVVLYLGSPELLSFCIFGISMVSVLSGKAPLKGLTVACLGLMLSLIGSDPQTGTLRWTFNSLYLWDHLPLVPVTLGIFAIPEIADMAISRTGVISQEIQAQGRTSTVWEGIGDVLRNWWLVLRCSGLGAMLGAVPGLGSAVIDWMAYGHALRTEKNTENFGHGDIRGLIAAESSNNAKEGGHLVPTIAFGMPAGASMALLLSAFMMHGFTPGPEMLTTHLDVTYSIIWTLTIAHITGAIICLSASNVFAKLATLRVGLLVPAVLSIIFLGAYDSTHAWGDLISMVLFGCLGWIMKKLAWPRPPIILGLVLGSMVERYYFISDQAYGPKFLTRPIVVLVFLGAAWVIVGPMVRAFIRRSHAGAAARESRRVFRPRFDAQVLFTLVLIAIAATAALTSLHWHFAARLMPLTASTAALIFGCLALGEQFLGIEIPHEPAGVLSSGKLVPQKFDRVIGARAFRFFLWFTGTLAVAALVGLLPALFLMLFLLMHVEFGEKLALSVSVAGIMTAAQWVVFGWLFTTPWPLAVIGDYLPRIRSVTGIF